MTNKVDSALLLHAYVDNELDMADTIAVERKIEGDPAFAAEVTRTQALRSALRERMTRQEVPPQLRARIDTAIELASGGRRMRSVNYPTWRALAASVVLAVALGSGSTWLALQPTQGTRTTEAVVDSHIRALLAPQPVDLSSSERHTVKPWFSTRLPVSPRVVDLYSEGFPLIGGRIDVIGTVVTPTVVYGRRKHVISVFAVPGANPTGASSISKPVNGYNVVTWRQDQVKYWAISDLNSQELEAFAQAFRVAQ